MDLTNINLYNYKYKIEKFLITAPTLSEPYEVKDSFIGNFEIEKNFDTHVLPYFEFTINIPNGVMRALLKSNNNVKVNLIIKYTKYGSEKFRVEKNSSRYTGFLNGVFKMFIDDQDPSLNEQHEKEYEKSIGINETTMDPQNSSMMKVVLYNEMYLNGTITIVNDIIINATLLDVITYILNKSKMKNILISPPSNNKIPSQFVIEPMSAIEQLDYLSGEYNLHKNGTLIFFDIDRGYIIDKSPKCTAYQLNEYKKTYLISMNKGNNSTNGTKSGCVKFDKEKCNICMVSSKAIQSTSNYDFNKQIHGNNLMYIDSNTGNTSVINTDGGNIDGVVYSKKGEDGTNALQNKLKESKKNVTIALENVDINFFTPNKEFIISTDTVSSNINGSYRISKLNASFKKDGKEYSSVLTCDLKGF